MYVYRVFLCVHSEGQREEVLLISASVLVYMIVHLPQCGTSVVR
jgi:hypothetical protein